MPKIHMLDVAIVRTVAIRRAALGHNNKAAISAGKMHVAESWPRALAIADFRKLPTRDITYTTTLAWTGKRHPAKS